jgi:hypothetical protein
MTYLETSAKVGDNIGEAFVRTATTIMKKGLATAPALDKNPMITETPVIVNPAAAPPEKGGCNC